MNSGRKTKFGIGGNASFETTHWTVVLNAARNGSSDNLVALQQLCGIYWYPIFVFIRRKGHGQHDAEDLTQMFFVHVLSKGALEKVDQTKGRFRNFLLASVTNFLSNERDKATTQKRGGAHRLVAFDECSAEELYRHEPVDRFTPERLFERRWAFVLMERVMGKLRGEHASNGKLRIYEQLQPFLTAEADAVALARSAECLGVEADALKVAVHRLRRRYGMLLRNEIAQTVSSPEEVEAEIRNLMSVIAE